MENVNNLTLAIRAHKPAIRDISVASYVGYLTALHKKMGTDDPVHELKWMQDFDRIVEVLQDKSYLGQRNILTAVVVGMQALGAEEDELEKYVVMRDVLQQQYNDNITEGSGVSEKQQQNMINRKELDGVITEQERYVKFFKLKTKEKLTSKELRQLQLYVVLRFHQAHPLRNDLASVVCMRRVELKKVEKPDELNVLLTDEGKLILNKYKTSRTYGTITVKLDKPMISLLRVLMKQTAGAGIENPSRHLLVKASGTPFTSNEYSQMLAGVFREKLGKSVSTTLLRKVYLSKYSETLSDMNEDAAIMGHSLATQHSVYTPS
eukprot:SAG22_NODE_509_length_9598_cov_12.010001_3_plen_321_part_00